jgi:anti-anti-sigma factor
MKISLGGIERDGFVKLAVDGNVTAMDFSADGKNPIEGALGPAWTSFRVLLDFGSVPYIDSSAIGWLIATQKAFREAGGALAVYRIQPAVRQVLDLLKVGKVVPLCENEQAARDAASAAASQGGAK